MSDSESDEDVRNLREAVDPQFAFNLYQNGKDPDCSVTQVIPERTTRKHRLQNADRNNQNSPEFSHFVARKLSEILDRRIKVGDVAKPNREDEQNKEKGGIKLFASSETVLNDSEHVPKIKQKKPDLLKSARKAKSAKSGEDTECQDEQSRLASVVVSADWIMSGSDRF